MEDIKEHIQNCDLDFFVSNAETLLDFRDEHGNDVILLSYLYGQKEITNYLFTKINCKYTVRNKYGYSILHIASMRNDRSIIDSEHFKESKLHRESDWKSIGNLLSNKKWSDGLNTAGKVLDGICRLVFSLAGVKESEPEKAERYTEQKLADNERKEEFERKLEIEVNKFTSIYTKEYFENARKSVAKRLEEKNKELKQKEIEKDKTIEMQLKNETKNLKDNYYDNLLLSSGYKNLTAPKDEFETTEIYQRRLEDAEKIKSEIEIKMESFDIDFEKEIKEKKEMLINEYQQNLDFIKREISETNLELDFYDNYVFRDNSKNIAYEQVAPLNIIELKNQYDADKQYFNIEIITDLKETLRYKLYIPIEIAKDVKNYLVSDNIENLVERKPDGSILRKVWITYNEKEYHFEKEN